jgi:signal transduction histidine kinase
MTDSSIPAVAPRPRLWLAIAVLTCCSFLLIGAVPVLFRGSGPGWGTASGWPLVACGAADAVLLAVIIMTLVARRAVAGLTGALADREGRLRQLEQAYKQREQAFLKMEGNFRLQEEGFQQHDGAYREREQQLLQELTELTTKCAELSTECATLRAGSAELAGSLSKNARQVRELVEHALTVRLPAALAGDPVPQRPAALADEPGTDGDVAVAALLDQAVAQATAAGDRQESMRSAVVALARRVQTSAHRLQEEATLMAERHSGDADVLEVSMRVDHAAAQQARHAQSMAVLCGEWPGQQWPDALPLVDLVRAAAGRIIAYQRIQVAGDPDIAAAAPVVEPLIHLVAELLANATQSSPPTTEVPVTVRSVQRGAVIEIHDCGVGLDEYRLELARDVATGNRVVELDGLGEFPQTGLPVVGQYVRRHGFRVDLSESVYGGVRAVVGIPLDMVETVAPADAQARAAQAPVPDFRSPADSRALSPRGGLSADGLDADGIRSDGLPVRRSPRHGLEAPASASAAMLELAPPPEPRAPEPREPEPREPVTPEEAGAWMGAFLGSASAGNDAAGAGAHAKATGIDGAGAEADMSQERG